MNDQPLTAEHGFPLRTLVPGFIGARSVKWLTKITVSDRPSPNHYVAEAYKLVQSDDKAELAAAEPIYALRRQRGDLHSRGRRQTNPAASPLPATPCPPAGRSTISKVEVSRPTAANLASAKLQGEARPSPGDSGPPTSSSCRQARAGRPRHRHPRQFHARAGRLELQGLPLQRLAPRPRGSRLAGRFQIAD